MADELVWDDAWMADHQVAEGWWIADDGRWFAPHLHPSVLAPVAPAPQAQVPETAVAETAVAETPVAETPPLAARADHQAEELSPQSEQSMTPSPTAPSAQGVEPPLPFWVERPESGGRVEATRARSLAESASATPTPTPMAAQSETGTKPSPPLENVAGSNSPARNPQPTGPKPGRTGRRLLGLLALCLLAALVWFVGRELFDWGSSADGSASAPNKTATTLVTTTTAAATPTSAIASETASSPATAIATTLPPKPTTTEATEITAAPTTTTTMPITTTVDEPGTTVPKDAGNPASTQRALEDLELEQLRDALYAQDLFAVVALSDAELSAAAASVCQTAEFSETGSDYDVGIGRIAGDLDVDIMVAMSIGQIVLEQRCPEQIERLGL